VIAFFTGRAASSFQMLGDVTLSPWGHHYRRCLDVDSLCDADLPGRSALDSRLYLRGGRGGSRIEMAAVLVDHVADGAAIGILTIVGLAAKDAILIIEFAKTLRAQGKPLIEIRHRSILSSLPAYFDDWFCFHIRCCANGGRIGSELQKPTGAWHGVVMGGMIAVVVLALLMVPTLFVVIQKLFSRGGKENGGRELTGTSATVCRYIGGLGCRDDLTI